jgi:TonB family protein
MIFAAALFAFTLQTAAPAPSPALAPQSTAAAPVADEPLTPPRLVYPPDAQAARIQGTVRLEIHVDPTGRVTSVTALEGPVQLRQAAIDAYSQVTYRPLLTNGRPAPAIITTAVNFTLSEAPPTTDMQVNQRFQPLHRACQQQSAEHAPDALKTCRAAVAMANRFSPSAELEARATAYNDLVLLLIAGGKYDGSGKPVPNPNLPEAGALADQAVSLVDSLTKTDPHKPAVAVAYITRAEVRSLANQLPGAAADCSVAEEVLNTLLADQGKKAPSKIDETENERAGNYRIQLKDTMLLHAIVLEREHKNKEARAIRFQAEHI